MRHTKRSKTYGLPKPIPTERRSPTYPVEWITLGLALIVIVLDLLYWRAG
jgi:hypothetical protein